MRDTSNQCMENIIIIKNSKCKLLKIFQMLKLWSYNKPWVWCKDPHEEKHTSLDKQTHPRICDLWDNQFEKSYEMKRHMLTHTCIEFHFNCEDCKYGGQNKGSMEVHIGRNHSDKFECGLCYFEAESKQVL